MMRNLAILLAIWLGCWAVMIVGVWAVSEVLRAVWP